jgi:hypothetical protein
MAGPQTTPSTGNARSSPRGRSRILRAVSGKFGYLLGALTALILSSPLMAEGWFWNVAYITFASAVLVASLYAARPGRQLLVIGLIVALIDVGIRGLAMIEGAHGLVLLQILLWLATLIFVIATLFEAMFDSDVVTVETVQASLCIYLLIGVLWVYLYALIDLLAPGSYVSQDGTQVNWSDDRSKRSEFMRLFVFSFSTLSGTGYGGVTAAGGFATIVASLEAIIAQIYLAVVIARLVGIQSAQPPE